MAGAPTSEGWVNIPWNTLSQNVLTLFSVTEHLGTTGTLPPQYLPLFLHEFTHHWCFNSSVGAAITILREQALQLVKRPDFQAETVLRQIHGTLFRYFTTLRILM